MEIFLLLIWSRLTITERNFQIQYILPQKKRSKNIFLIFSITMLTTYIVLICLIFIDIFPEVWDKVLYDLSNTFFLAMLLGVFLIKIPEILTSSKKIELIESFINLKKYKEAKEILFDLIKTSRKTYEYFNLLGRIELEKISGKEDSNLFSNSWNYFQRALELVKRNKISIYNNLTLWFFLKNELNSCKKLNEEILRRKPKNLIALARKIDILEKEKNYEDLIEFFEKKIKYLKTDFTIFSYYLYIYYRCVKKSSNDQKKINLALEEAPISKHLPFINIYNLGIMYYHEEIKKSLTKILEKVNRLVIPENLNDEQRENLKRWAIFTRTN